MSLPRLAKLTRHISSKNSGPVDEHFPVLVLGGGNSCGYFCRALKEEHGYGEGIGIVSRESVAPYERPALTKAFLHHPGAAVRARLPGFHTCVGGGGSRQTEAWYEDNKIKLVLSTSATSVDVETRTVEVIRDDGAKKVFGYDKLVLATGARALTALDVGMTKHQHENVFTIREVNEGMEMIKVLESGKMKNVIIVGGGYIGVETAAALSGWGFSITVVFPEDQLMSRVLPKEIAEVFEAQFQSRGIKFVRASVNSLVSDTENPNVCQGISLKDGSVLHSDAVIVGIGARLNLDIVSEMGIAQANKGIGGVLVNDKFQTSIPSIFAIGDIAAVENFPQRYEHVDFCRKSAAQAAKFVVEKGENSSSEEFKYSPFFYSRMFEYTTSPLTFYLYGTVSSEYKMQTFGDIEKAKINPVSSKMPVFGTVWTSGNIIKALLLCNASNERLELARGAVLDGGKELSIDFLEQLLS